MGKSSPQRVLPDAGATKDSGKCQKRPREQEVGCGDTPVPSPQGDSVVPIGCPDLRELSGDSLLSAC